MMSNSTYSSTHWTYSPDLQKENADRSKLRTSSYTIVNENSTDATVSCILDRTKRFLGFIPFVEIEELQIGRTQEGQQHPFHVDYYLESELELEEKKNCNRAASFFVFMSDVEQGGETYFPLVDIPSDAEAMDMSKFRKITTPDGFGLMVKPVKGNAIFWMNMLKNGTMDERMVHSGIKVSKGTKYGLNILVLQCT